MSDPVSAETDELARFQRSYSRRGLLIRYASGRVSHFVNRQFLTLVGGGALWLMNGPLSGICAMVLALLGEAVDCLYLRWAAGALNKRGPLRRIYITSTLTAGFQAVTISLCVAMAWFGPVSYLSPLFAIGFLSGAVANAGLVMPFHPAAAIARLGVYAVAVLTIFFVSLVLPDSVGWFLVMNAFGTLMLAYMVHTFLSFVTTGFRLNRDNTLALIEKGQELSRTNEQLTQRQKEAQQLSLVARNGNDSVVLVDRQGRITWVNDAFTRLNGFTLDEAIGQSPFKLLMDFETNKDSIAAITDAIRRGLSYRGEVLHRTKQGREIWMDTNLVPVLDADGAVEMVVSVERDVTEARLYAEKMSCARKAAEDAARAKADFLATMSHEIRTPMNGVIGMADMLAGTPLNPDQRLYADTIRSSAQVLLTIINDILDLSKLDAGKVRISPVAFDLQACLADTVQLMKPQAVAKGLELTLESDPGLPQTICADDGRLRQILNNLIGNAIKFTETGSVRVMVNSDPRADGVMLTFDVRDTGIGIPAEKLDQIFERFAQADATTTRRFGGTGLGLTISRLLIEAMGGQISVTSQPGAGTCFCFALPVARADGPPVPAPGSVTHDPADADRDLAGKRVLVAEDNKVNRLLIRKYLQDLPLTLEFAHDGQQAVDMVACNCPDLVFMDMSMPGMNGLEATRHIRAAGGCQPVIVALTANAMDSDRQACLAAGMDDFLAKPVRRSDLVDCLVECCKDPVQPCQCPDLACRGP